LLPAPFEEPGLAGEDPLDLADEPEELLELFELEWEPLALAFLVSGVE
jgi:hypothetical protein